MLRQRRSATGLLRAIANMEQRQAGAESFTANVLILMTGATAAQVIPIAMSPVLSRLYTLEEFGVFAVFSAVVSVLAIVTTGRYELAIMLPRSDEESVNIVALVVLLSLAASVTTLVLVILLRPEAGFGVGQLDGKWLYLVPPMIFVMGVYQALTYWTNRRGRYRRLAVSDVTLRGSSEAAKLLLRSHAIAPFVGNGLITGTVGGQVLATLILSGQVWREDRHKGRSIRLDKVRSAILGYRKFPAFNVPYSAVSVLGHELMVFSLTAFHLLEPAGLFNFARRIVSGPVSFLSISIGRVFFQEAAFSIGTEHFEHLTLGLMSRLADVSTPAFVFFAFWAPEIFSHVFGTQWIEAGHYASLLTPSAFFLLFTSWPERVYEVTQKQHLSFSLQVGCDAVRAVTIWSLLTAGARPIISVGAYSLIGCLYNAAYLWGIFAVGGLPRAALYRLARKVAIVAAVFAMLFSGLELLGLGRALQFLLGLAMLAAYYGYTERRHARSLIIALRALRAGALSGESEKPARHD